jgi:hypothetical protein
LGYDCSWSHFLVLAIFGSLVLVGSSRRGF